MKASELRIGNLVLLKKFGKSDKECAVAAIDGQNETKAFYCLNINHYAEYWAGLEEVESIPLTEEWLLKFGFSHIRQNFYKRYNFIIELFGVGSLAAYVEGPEHYILITEIVDFVHQLQNLYFALTGEELTIQLT